MNSNGLQILKSIPGNAAVEAFNSLYFGGLNSAHDEYDALVAAIKKYDEFVASLPTEVRWTPTPNSFTLAKNIAFLAIAYGDDNWQKLRQMEANIVDAVNGAKAAE